MLIDVKEGFTFGGVDQERADASLQLNVSREAGSAGSDHARLLNLLNPFGHNPVLLPSWCRFSQIPEVVPIAAAGAGGDSNGLSQRSLLGRPGLDCIVLAGL